MLAVVGSRHDPAARDLAAQWARFPHGAALLACEDFSKPGWRLCPSSPDSNRAVISGALIPEREISGVLMRRLWILPAELTHIAREDRDYVSSEVSAFLLAWLDRLSCRVVNRPRGTSLCGPGWRPIQWAQAASRAGIQVDPCSCFVPALPNPALAKPAPSLFVTLAGTQCFDAPSPAHEAAARSLAALAEVDLLTVRFASDRADPVFLSATAMPSLQDPRIAEAVRTHLLSGGPQ